MSTPLKIYTFGSCRTVFLKEFDRSKYTIYNNYDFLHNTKEVIMYLDLLEGIITMDDIPYNHCLMINPEKFNPKKYYDLLMDADIVTIEVSTLKIVRLEDFYYQLIRSSNSTDFSKFSIEMETAEGFAKDVDEIARRIKKPIVYISHLNLDFYDDPILKGRIEQRDIIDGFLENYCQHYVLLKDVFNTYNYKLICECKNKVDTNHYTQFGFKVLSEYMYTYFQKFI